MSKDAKRSCVLYYDYRAHLTLLTDEERGRLLMALLDYGELKKEPELEGAALMAFSFIRAQMDRDAAKYAETCRKRSEAGKRGGRPSEASAAESKQGETNASQEKQTEAKKANAFSEKQTEAKKADTDNENDNDTDNDTDTDIFISDKDNYTPPPKGGGEATAAPAADPTPYKAIVELYHDICKSYPRLRNVSASRERAMAARWKEYRHDLETFRELFTRAEASSFLKGRNKRSWAADFNWLMNGENMAKVLEGAYDDAKGGQGYGEHREPAGRQEYAASGSATATLSGFTMAGD